MANSASLVSNRLWHLCHTLRHEGIDYGEYVDQLVSLLFLKLAEEKKLVLPAGCSWSKLKKTAAARVQERYGLILKSLACGPRTLSELFAGADARIKSSSLRLLIDGIDSICWSDLEPDVPGAAFESILERAATEGKKGAGQYFTPRALIDAIVTVVQPDPTQRDDFSVHDPACGTAGFLIAAFQWLVRRQPSTSERTQVRRTVYSGAELVSKVRRLAIMNLYLHGLRPNVILQDTIYAPKVKKEFDVILTNPPFGTRGARLFPDRPGFWLRTADKQMNFLQHVLISLKKGGRAAVVVPDSCLFGENARLLLKELMRRANVHTVLRLPEGTFSPYTAGTKTNVLFFCKGETTDVTWIYDARTNIASINKTGRRLVPEFFKDFIVCFGNEPSAKARRNPQDSVDGRWRAFSRKEMHAAGFNLDRLRWLEPTRDNRTPTLDELNKLLHTTSSEVTAISLALERLKLMVQGARS